VSVRVCVCTVVVCKRTRLNLRHMQNFNGIHTHAHIGTHTHVPKNDVVHGNMEKFCEKLEVICTVIGY